MHVVVTEIFWRGFRGILTVLLGEKNAQSIVIEGDGPNALKWVRKDFFPHSTDLAGGIWKA